MDRTDSRLAPSPEPASDDVASPSNPSAEEAAYWRGVADGLARAGGPVAPDVAARAAAPPCPGLRPDEPPPWEGAPTEETGRRRHDAFTGAKKQIYLKALAKTGCILDACRITGVSSSTVYNHQASDPDFARYCQLAVSMAATPIELTAYERATVGHEEPVIRGGKVVGTRIRRSDYMLRILLQGSNPRKYGPRPGFKRKRLLKFERKQMEREIYAKIAATERTGEEAVESILAKVEAISRHRDAKRRAEGWTELGCQVWVPPGWVWAGEGDPSEAAAEAMEKIGAAYNSSNSSNSSSSDGFASPSGEEAEPFETSGSSQEEGRDLGPIEYKSLIPPPASFRRIEPVHCAPHRVAASGGRGDLLGEPVNKEVRRSNRRCPWLPDQVRDDGRETARLAGVARRTFPPPRAFPR